MNCLKTFIIILLAYFQSGCTKSVETLEGSDVFTYFPVAIGNAITYSLDSTRYIQVGAEKEIRSYIIKDSVETLTNETAKSKTYRIARLVRNEFDSTLWTRLSTYYITIDSSRLELMESNKKYLQLVAPIKDGLKWNRNAYSTDSILASYSNTDQSDKVNNDIIPKSTTLLIRNDTISDPKDKKRYSAVYHWKEIYGKNIGLLFMERTEEIWQPPNANCSTGYYEDKSFHIKITFLKSNFRK